MSTDRFNGIGAIKLASGADDRLTASSSKSNDTVLLTRLCFRCVQNVCLWSSSPLTLDPLSVVSRFVIGRCQSSGGIFFHSYKRTNGSFVALKVSSSINSFSWKREALLPLLLYFRLLPPLYTPRTFCYTLSVRCTTRMRRTVNENDRWPTSMVYQPPHFHDRCRKRRGEGVRLSLPSVPFYPRCSTVV